MIFDQEQRRYRFFVEHNIPPRVVWLTRQLPWFVIVFVWSLLALLVYGIHGSSGLFWDIVYSTLPQHYYDHHTGVFDAISPVLTHLFLGLKFAMVAFAAGQWASMVVRSGLLSGFFGLLLGAVLCGWVLLMEAMSLSWLWTVLPIPLVLLWATWLRAPDWARENTQWSARFRAAAVVLIPALTLMVAVPYYRVHEIPDVSPGFEPAAYPAEITPEAKATAELYRRANELYVSVPQPIQPEPADNVGRAPHHNQLQWLKNNSESLALVLEASRSDSCALDDPATMTSITWLPNGAPLIQLIVTSGRQLEAEGKLDEALDRYLTALKVIDHWTRFALYNEVFHRIASANRVFSQLNYWASQKGQTPERIAAAIKRIGELDLIAPRIQDALESNYIITRRYLRGDESVLPVLYPNKKVSGPTQSQILWRKLMPWETTRELQRLAWATASALFRLQNMRYNIDRGKGIVDELPSLNSGLNAAHLDLAWRNIADEGSLAKCLCDFEVHRRATILILALESYQLRQGRLPETLAEIAGPDLPKLPVDPYSGRPYVYFSNGLPAPATPLDQAELQEARRYARHFVYLPSLPFIWSTGPELRSVGWRASSAIDPANPATNDSEVVVNYELRDGFGETHRLPTYQALFRGLWFAIPNPVYEPK